MSAASNAADEIPRRIRMDLWTPAEKAIGAAITAVELSGADPRLTAAVCLLAKAKDRVADFVDGVEPAPMPNLGQIAYEGYCSSSGGKSLITGAALAPWGDLKPEIRSAWGAAAAAVVAATETPR